MREERERKNGLEKVLHVEMEMMIEKEMKVEQTLGGRKKMRM